MEKRNGLKNNIVVKGRSIIGLLEFLELIDKSIFNRRSLTIVCNRKLAELLMECIEMGYKVDTVNAILEDQEIQYVTLYFDHYDKGKLKMYCENAMDKNETKYKTSDMENIDYIITTNMTYDDVVKYLQGDENSTWSRFTIKIDDENLGEWNENGDCDECGEELCDECGECEECDDCTCSDSQSDVDVHRNVELTVTKYTDLVKTACCEHKINDLLRNMLSEIFEFPTRKL
jgi:hypothetical protein